jgi:hypothetical protein
MNVNVSDIISNAFSHSLAINLFKNKNKELIPNKLIEFYSKKINPNSFTDKDLIKNFEIYDNINWDIIEKNKAIRVLARNINLLEKIDIKKIKITTIDLYPIFIQHPELINEFVEDFDELTPLEAIRLLECNNDLIEYIDLSKYNFNKKDMQELVNKFSYSTKIMERLDLTYLDHFVTRKLICKTGIDYIDRLNLKQLKASDWIEILEQHPYLLEYCDLSKFETNDCYLLTFLVVKFPELDYLIVKNSDKISALGWERLIQEDLERFYDICDWSKFSETNWSKILKKYPQLSNLKQKYYIF